MHWPDEIKQAVLHECISKDISIKKYYEYTSKSN